MITLNVKIQDINEAIRNRYTEDSDIEDLLLRNEKDLEEWILDAIDFKLNPPSNARNEMVAFQLGQKYH